MIKILLLVTTLFLSAVSCTSVKVISHGSVRETVSIQAGAVFIKPVRVVSFDTVAGKGIGLIMDRKLHLNMLEVGRVVVTEHEEDRGIFIVPELIVKGYEKNYRQRYYYLLHIEVSQNGSMAGSFHYEYNGTASLFESRMQNVLVRRFMRDLKKLFS